MGSNPLFASNCQHQFVKVRGVRNGKRCALCGFAYAGEMIPEVPEMTREWSVTIPGAKAIADDVKAWPVADEALVPKSVIAEALEHIEKTMLAEACFCSACGVYIEYGPGRAETLPHADDCSYVRVRDALKALLGEQP